MAYLTGSDVFICILETLAVKEAPGTSQQASVEAQWKRRTELSGKLPVRYKLCI